MLTGGEGYHSYHHQYPGDYRNGPKWYHFDTTKWVIYFTYILGLASHLRTSSDNEIKKAELTFKLKKLKKEQESISWPLQSHELPVLSWDACEFI